MWAKIERPVHAQTHTEGPRRRTWCALRWAGQLDFTLCNHAHKQAWWESVCLCVRLCVWVCSPECVKNSRKILCQREKSPVALTALLGIFTLSKVTHRSKGIKLSPHTLTICYMLWLRRSTCKGPTSADFFVNTLQTTISNPDLTSRHSNDRLTGTIIVSVIFSVLNNSGILLTHWIISACQRLAWNPMTCFNGWQGNYSPVPKTFPLPKLCLYWVPT